MNDVGILNEKACKALTRWNPNNYSKTRHEQIQTYSYPVVCFSKVGEGKQNFYDKLGKVL